MKKFIHPLSIVIMILIILLSLPLILPKKKIIVYTDDELRHKALSSNMLPTPTSYEGLLEIANNPQNPLSPNKIALGKELFNEKLLSKDKDISCASCHKLQQGGDDNLAVAIGHKNRANPSHLNSPTVLNSALAKSQFWDGRAKDVEAQASGPIQASFEMNMQAKEVLQRLNNIPDYVNKFQEVFQKDIEFEDVQKAIGAYERTLLTYGDYDRFLEGNNSALNPKAKKGMTLFMTKGCRGCHTGISVGGQSVQKFPLRNYVSDYLGMIIKPNLKLKDSPFPFENHGGFMGYNDSLRFRVPLLRNISKTAPYFHNGAIKDLNETVRIMSKYQIGEEFNPTQIEEVVEFLKTLDGELVEYNITN